MIGQVNAAFEGRIKSTVHGTFITLPCCRTTEMRKRQHSEDDNKDIMMGNTTLKCQWNGQFWKPSGKQVLQKHDNLLNGFPALLLLFFFFSPAVPQWILSWLLVQKIKGRGKNVKQKQSAKAWSVCLHRWGRWRFAWLSLQEMENFSTEDGRSRLEKEFTARFILSHLKHLEE